MDEGAKDTTPKMEYDAGPAPTCPYCGYMQGHNRVCISVELAEVRAQLTATERERDFHARMATNAAHLAETGTMYRLQQENIALTTERDALRHLIATGASRGAEISPFIRRIFSAGSQAAAERDALMLEIDGLREAVREAAKIIAMAAIVPVDVGVKISAWLARPAVSQALEGVA